MAEQDQQGTRGRPGGTDWFIDFEQGDLGADAVTPRARRRPGQSDPATPKPGAQAKTTGPSPWVADFLLNQVDGTRIEPTVRRKPVPAMREHGTKQDRPAQHDRSGTGTAQVQSAAIDNERGAHGRTETPEPIPQAGRGSPSPTAAKAGTGGYGIRSYTLAAALVLGASAGLVTLREGGRWNTVPDRVDAQSSKVAAEAPQPDRPAEPREAWRDLPVQAAAIVQPGSVDPAQGPPGASPVAGHSPIEVASLQDAPPVVTFAPPPASTQPSPPVWTARIVRSPGATATPLGAAVEVTAREVDEGGAVAAGPTSAADPGIGAQADARTGEVPPTPKIVPTRKKITAAIEDVPQATPLRHHFRAARRNDRRRQAARPASPRVAQATQTRSIALPAVLRPTSF